MVLQAPAGAYLLCRSGKGSKYTSPVCLRRHTPFTVTNTPRGNLQSPADWRNPRENMGRTCNLHTEICCLEATALSPKNPIYTQYCIYTAYTSTWYLLLSWLLPHKHKNTWLLASWAPGQALPSWGFIIKQGGCWQPRRYRPQTQRPLPSARSRSTSRCFLRGTCCSFRSVVVYRTKLGLVKVFCCWESPHVAWSMTHVVIR